MQAKFTLEELSAKVGPIKVGDKFANEDNNVCVVVSIPKEEDGVFGKIGVRYDSGWQSGPNGPIYYWIKLTFKNMRRV